MENAKPVCTPMATSCKLGKDDESSKTNQSIYKSMIRGLLYLISIRVDIIHVVCLVAIFQQDPKEIHVVATKRIFRYLKGAENYFFMVSQKI